jgi:DNA-binding HxlR family transcriptional regulator
MSGIEMKKAALRLKMYAVHIATIDKYALGVHDSLNQGQAVFKLMREALNPSDVLNIQLKELEQKSDVQQLRETGVFNLFFNIQDGGNKNAS